MPSAVVSCPYCNSAVAVPPGAALGQRIACPRCGESFPYRGPSDEPAAAPSAPPSPVEEPAPQPTATRFSNRDIGLFVLGLMCAAALLGLAYALHTQGERREHDTALPKSQAIDVPLFARVALGVYVAGLVFAIVWGWNRRERADNRPWTRRLSVPVLAVLALIGIGLAMVAIQGRPGRTGPEKEPSTLRQTRPADLPALGYLPDDTDLILAVHAAELLANPVGRDLVFQVGTEAVNPRSVEAWSGIKLDDIDHAVLGLKLTEELPTRFTLVVRTRRPIQPERVREALKAKDAQDVDGRTASPFVLRTALPLFREVGANAWFADDYTLVIAKTFEHVPTQPRVGVDHLRPALRELLRERMGPAAQIWAAGDVPPWDKVFPPLQGLVILSLDRKDAATLKKVRTFGVWLAADDEGATLRAAIHCDDAAAAEALEEYLVPRDDKKGLKALAARQDAGRLAREFAGSLQPVRAGDWLELQAKASPDAVRGEKK